jgi:hypothetical protein
MPANYKKYGGDINKVPFKDRKMMQDRVKNFNAAKGRNK